MRFRDISSIVLYCTVFCCCKPVVQIYMQLVQNYVIIQSEGPLVQACMHAHMQIIIASEAFEKGHFNEGVNWTVFYIQLFLVCGQVHASSTISKRISTKNFNACFKY